MTVKDAKKWFRIYYSQNREDLILKALFPDVVDGFYVDVGAHDTEIFSVTKIFYEEGWRGINIEPQTSYYQKFKKDRPKDINLNIAISDKKGEMLFREYPEADGLSTLSPDMKASYHNDGYLKGVTSKFNDYKVAVDTLDSVFEKHLKGRLINFLKIDVEGLETKVLMSNNWDKYRPQVLCIEANHVFEEWHDILKNAKYTKIFHDGLNEYFAANEHIAHFNEVFDYSKSVLSQISVNSIPFKMFLAEMEKLYKDNKKISKILDNQDRHIKKLGRDIQTQAQTINELENNFYSLGRNYAFRTLRKLRIIKVRHDS